MDICLISGIQSPIKHNMAATENIGEDLDKDSNRKKCQLLASYVLIMMVWKGFTIQIIPIFFPSLGIIACFGQTDQ